MRQREHPLPFHVSRWVTLAVMIDGQAAADLLAAVDPVHLYKTGGVIAPSAKEYDRGQLVEQLGPNGQGELPSLALSTTDEVLYWVAVGEERIIVRAERPVVQIRSARPPGVGIELSYPQLFQDPVTGAIEKVTDADRFPNTLLFKKIRRWVRHGTVPRTGTTVRWGKNLLHRLDSSM